MIPSVLHILANRTDQNRLELGQLLPQSQAASVFNRTPFRFVAFASRSSPCSVFAKFFAAVSPWCSPLCASPVQLWCLASCCLDGSLRRNGGRRRRVGTRRVLSVLLHTTWCITMHRFCAMCWFSQRLMSNVSEWWVFERQLQGKIYRVAANRSLSGESPRPWFTVRLLQFCWASPSGKALCGAMGKLHIRSTTLVPVWRPQGWCINPSVVFNRFQYWE